MPDNKNPDPIREHYGRSIYQRQDYIVNSDMTIPYALARGFMASIQSEAIRRTGLPGNSREPAFTAIVLHPPYMPEGK